MRANELRSLPKGRPWLPERAPTRGILLRTEGECYFMIGGPKILTKSVGLAAYNCIMQDETLVKRSEIGQFGFAAG